MEISQTEKVEDLHVLHPNDPVCFIDDLPSELLSHILEFTCVDDNSVNNLNFKVELAFWKYNDIMRWRSDVRDDEGEGDSEARTDDGDIRPSVSDFQRSHGFRSRSWFPMSPVTGVIMM